MSATGRRSPGSYIEETEPRRVAAELERLRQQVELSWAKERALLGRLALPEEAAILDLGCGPGFFTERLAEVFPQASITGLDRSPALLDAARRRFGGRRRNAEQGSVRFVEGDLPAALAGLGPFDLIVCRYVLQHLLDPAATLAALHGRLKPGGAAVLIDVDSALLGVAEPSNGALAAIHRRAGAAQWQRGGNRAVGRWLYRYLAGAGFHDIDLTALVLHSDEFGLDRFRYQMDPALLDDALAAGAITPAEHALVCHETARFEAAPDALVMMLLFAATGRRATAPASGPGG